jgi:methyltransferase (TIGR00027 family)
VKASRTAAYVALYRALETDERRREPLFRDPLARLFLPRGLRAAVRLARVKPLRSALERYADRRAPGARSSAICRTRFIDDFARREAREGARQLVILGAGFDGRAHRLGELATTRVFEVDQPATQAEKRAALAHATGLRADVRYVAVDFERDDLATSLRAAGWDANERTTFVWEGVSNYLEAEAVDAVLRFVARAAPGSELVFTYLHRGVIDGSTAFEGAELLVANVRRLGEPWKFGIDPAELEGFLAERGLQLEENLGADEYRTRYAWAGSMKGYAFYRIAIARVTLSA